MLAHTPVRGAVRDPYPCPFLDATGHGYGRVMVNAPQRRLPGTDARSSGLLGQRAR